MSIFTLRSGGTAHPEDSLLQMIADLIAVSGVKDLSAASNNFKVVQRGAGANMSVDVGIGRAIIKSGSTAYPVRNSAAENKTVTNNTSGNPRIDAVVLYIDLAASPNADSSNVAKLAVVAGTAAASPVAPDDSAVTAAIGANPFIRLAHVTVIHNETTIENADISDQRTQFRTVHNLRASALTYGASLSIDVGEYNDRIITLTGNLTITGFANYTTDVPFVVRFVQGGSGGYTVDWPNTMDWAGGEPVVTPTLNKKDAYMIIPRSNGRFEGYIMGQDANIS